MNFEYEIENCTTMTNNNAYIAKHNGIHSINYAYIREDDNHERK